MYLSDLIQEALCEPQVAISYYVSRRLAELFPGRPVVEGDDWDFKVHQYARAGHCVLRRDESVHGQVATLWSDDSGEYDEPRNVWYEVDWGGRTLDVVLLYLEEGCVRHYWIMADDEALARQFFRAVCAWSPEPREEVLVFDGGRWEQSTGLYRSARSSDFDSLVLEGTLKHDLRSDLQRFFASRDAYAALGVPWKRGLLLTGPPGNGKTHAIKALVHELARPCLYVKSFVSERITEQTNIRRIFQRARRAAPCLVVLEDLDSLVNDDNRSFVLNELDGFAANEGIAFLATTNHPEKLDAAIVERPSRFDRKYHFGLPGAHERWLFLKRWAVGLDSKIRPTDACLGRLVGLTEGFSFAYLKELFLSSILAKAAADPAATLEAILDEQAGRLRDQMRPKAGHPREQDEADSIDPDD